MNCVKWTDELEKELCSPEEIEENNKAAEAVIPRLLTKEEAQSLQPPCSVWFEQTGGYDGSRYCAEQCNLHSTNPEYIHLTQTDSDGGVHSICRMWGGYNKRFCGWRLWSSEPTDKQRLSEPLEN